MPAHEWVRLAGPFAGVGLFLLIAARLEGWAGLILGMVAFFAASVASERYWRRRASPEDVRRDLEERTHNPPS